MNTLFDDTFVSSTPPLNGPGPMARKTDNIMSHRAADRVAVNRTAVAEAVLRIINQSGGVTGTEINEAYERLSRQHPASYPRVHFDSPRRRAGELARDERCEYITDGVRGHEGLFRSAR